MQGEQTASALGLSNTGKSALHAQVRIFHWTQADGNDKLTPTTDLVASPPMVSIEPGKRQLVRIIRVNDGLIPHKVERTFRLLVDELPGPGRPGVKFDHSYSIPVFEIGRAS